LNVIARRTIHANERALPSLHSTIFEMNVESYRRRAALDRKRGPGRPPTHATIRKKAD
jgi:hypothetical protein